MADSVLAAVDVLGGAEDMLGSGFGDARDGIKLVGDVAHFPAPEAAPVQRRDLLLGVLDGGLDEVELALELVDFPELRVISPIMRCVSRSRDSMADRKARISRISS
jgi:hypothetical protein